MDFTPILTNDCLLLIFDKVPLQQRLTTLSLVCRRWAQMRPMVRKAVTSVTLLLETGMPYKDRLISPFQLEEDQSTIITENHDLLRLCYHTSSLINANVLRAIDLTNIRKLTIVQLIVDLPLITNNLLPLVEQLAGQLTSFSFHYQPGYVPLKLSLDESAVSAGLQQLLSLVNYRMPRLRHLLLDIGFNVSYYWGQPLSFFSCEPDSDHLLGSLYLPVLRRLTSFSFHSKFDHIELLHYSLKTFAASNHCLRLRIVLPNNINSFEPFNDPVLWVWDLPVLQSQLEHLVVRQVSNASCLNVLSLPLARLTSLHLGPLDYDKPQTLMFSLFTALSTLPLLTTLHLDLKFHLARGGKERLPLPPLPPMPFVTSLKIWWCFDRLGPTNSFEAILNPVHVFPALRRLTVIDKVSTFVILKNSTAAQMPSWVGNSFRLAVLWRAIGQPLKLYPPGTLQTITIESTIDSDYQKVVLRLDDL